MGEERDHGSVWYPTRFRSLQDRFTVSVCTAERRDLDENPQRERHAVGNALRTLTFLYTPCRVESNPRELRMGFCSQGHIHQGDPPPGSSTVFSHPLALSLPLRRQFLRQFVVGTTRGRRLGGPEEAMGSSSLSRPLNRRLRWSGPISETPIFPPKREVREVHSVHVEGLPDSPSPGPWVSGSGIGWRPV